MKISAKTQYASLAVLELALRYESESLVCIREIVELHNIPQQYLVQILLQLKGAGYVSSTRGAAGGYRLSLPPDQITLGEVMDVFAGPDSEMPGEPVEHSPTVRALHATWNEVAQVERKMLHGTTFADLVEIANDPSQNMYYI